jgi:NADH:ubiquinone oxidoreductase subunit F (NADH-binding)
MSVVDIYACREQNARIMKVLKTTCSSEAFQEDVMEFIKVLQNVLVVVSLCSLQSINTFFADLQQAVRNSQDGG